MVDFVLRVASGLGDEQRDRDDLEGVRECLDDLPQVEMKVRMIAEYFNHR